MNKIKTVTKVRPMTRQEYADDFKGLERVYPWDQAKRPVKVLKQTAKNTRYTYFTGGVT